MRSHEVDYEILGDDLQMVEIELDPGETVIAEAGAMNYMEAGIEFEAKHGRRHPSPTRACSASSCEVGKRVLTGESVFLTHFTHRGPRQVSAWPSPRPYPGKIVRGGPGRDRPARSSARRTRSCAAALGTKVEHRASSASWLGAGFFGGEGFILQRLQGRRASRSCTPVRHGHRE